MNFNKTILLGLLCFVYSCTEEDIILFSTECIECIQHQYQQAIDNNDTILLTLEPGHYCLTDSAWLLPNGIDYWHEIDEALLNLMTESGYCQFVELEDTIN